jgi:hypothetical protein
MDLLDVNILVQAHREDSPAHESTLTWLMQALQKPVGVAVSDLVLSGVTRVITHPKIFKDPTPLVDALEFIEDFRNRPQVHILSPGPRHWKLFLHLCREGDARGNLVPDAYHAALALEYDCRWVTLDRGFARFPGLNWYSPPST